MPYTDEQLEQWFRGIVEDDIAEWCDKHPHLPNEEEEDEYIDACRDNLMGTRFSDDDDVNAIFVKRPKKKKAMMDFLKREALGDNDGWEDAEYFAEYYDLMVEECVGQIDAEEWIKEDE